MIKWHNTFFGELRVSRSNVENDYSAPKFTIDGRLVTQQGTGSRAVLSILCRLFQPSLEHLFIDEPEIGIEPQVQRKLLELLRKASAGELGMPKKNIVLASHSHLFLDKRTIANNYIVSRSESGSAKIQQVQTEQELHTLVFKLLGNSPEDLFFPKNIIVVEGPSDRIFLNRIMSLRGIEAVSVHFADNDQKVSIALPAIDQMMKTTSYLPLYRDRICVLVDKQTKPGILDEWKRYLGDKEGKRVIELGKNGIEYFYPRKLLCKLTGLSESTLDESLDAFIASIRRGEKEPFIGTFRG